MHKLLLSFLLVLVLAVSALGTDISISSFQVANSHGYTGSNIKLRVYFSGCPGGNFLTNDGQIISCGQVGAATGFYKEVAVTVDDSGTLTIPAFVLPSTDNSSSPGVRATAVFFVNGVRRDFLFSNYTITATLGTTLSYAQLFNYQPTALPGPPPSTYLTAQQIIALVPSLAQPTDADLTAIAALSPSNDDVIQRKAGVWAKRTPAQLKTDLVLVKGDVGLPSANDTSDADKPVSTAQQTALDLKANSASLALVATTGSATDLSTGILPDARLGANVPLKDGSNTFSGNNTFSAANTLTNTTTFKPGTDSALKIEDPTGQAITLGVPTGITSYKFYFSPVNASSGSINLMRATVPFAGLTQFTFSSTPWSVLEGGMGASTHTANSLLVGAGSSAVTEIAPGTSGWPLVSNGLAWAAAQLTATAFPSTLLDTDSTFTANSDSRIASQKAVNTAIQNAALGLQFKAPVVVATTANITLSGEQTIDGVLTSASRVTVKNQTTATENGIYVSAAGAWTRATDADTGTELAHATALVQSGTANVNTGWTVNTSPITIGVTDVNIVQFTAANVYTADGTSITVTANQFSVPDSGITNAKLAGSIAYSKLSLTGAVLSADLAGSVDAAKIGGGAVSTTEFDFLSTLTSNVQDQVDSKAAVNSQAFTGTPTLPTGTIATTQTAGNSTTALATTAFVTTAGNLKANLVAPSFTTAVGLSGATSPAIFITDTTNNAQLELVTQDTAAIIATTTNHDLFIGANNNSRLSVSASTGNVGVGAATAPSSLFHVIQIGVSGTPAFRVDDELTDTTPFLVDQTGNAAFGDITPDHKLDVEGNIGIIAGGYLNFGDTDGTTGYGFRDNAGVLQVKNSGGAWANFGAGGGGAVDSVFGRTGAVVATTNDYTFNQLNFAGSSLASLATRSAGDLSSGTLPAARMPALSGDITTPTGSAVTTLANTGVGAGSYTNSSLTVNSKGLITAISSGTGLLAANNLTDVANVVTAFSNIKQQATTTATGVVELATSGESAANVAVQGNDSRLPTAVGKVVYAKQYAGANLGAQINAADADCGSDPCTIVVTGGGALNTQVTVGTALATAPRTLRFEAGRYTSNLTVAVIRPKSYTTIQCFNAIIEEPTGLNNWTIIQPYNTSINNYDEDSDIRVTGCHFIGANAGFNSAPQTVSLGNLVNGWVTNNFFDGVRSIGLQAGGGSNLFGAVNISNATNATPIVVTTSSAHNFRDAQRVGVSGVAGNTRANTYATITNATNASPIVVTLVSPGVGWATGSRMRVGEVLGNTAANGIWAVTRISDTSYSLDGSTGNGAYTSGGLFEGSPWFITKLSSTTFSLNQSVGNGAYTSGGSVAKNANAENVWMTNNLFSHVASQNLACVNCRNVHMNENTFLAGGQAGGPGATYIDLEPNGRTDLLELFEINNNLIDARGAANAGNGIVVQIAGGSEPFGMGPGSISGNTIVGGEIIQDHYASEIANAIFVSGMSDIIVTGNVVRRAGQAGLFTSGSTRLMITNNIFTDVGGGGTAGFINQSTESYIAGNYYSAISFPHNGGGGTPGSGVGDPRILEDATSGSNTYKDNVGFTYSGIQSSSKVLSRITTNSTVAPVNVPQSLFFDNGFTLGGPVAGGGQQLNNIIIGTTAPLAGSFTTVLGSTSVSTPSLISTGAVGITPAAGSNLNVTLSTTGDFAVNTNQLYVDTSTARVGIGTASPATLLEVSGIARVQVQDKGGQLFNVLAYGAVCNGSTDDYAAFAAANSAAASAGGGTIFVPQKATACIVGSTLTLSANVSIRGAGMGATILKRKSTLVDGHLVTTGTNSTVSDLTIDGNYPARSSGTGVEIHVGGDRGTIERVEIKNPYYIGISYDSVSDSKVLNSVLTGPTTPTTGSAYGIHYAGPTAVRAVIAFNRITNWTVSAIYAGGTESLILGNYLEGNHTMFVETGGGQLASGSTGRTTVIGNYIGPGGASATSGMEVDNGAWIIEGNTIVGQQNYGIILQGGTGHILSNNKISGSGQDFRTNIATSAWSGHANTPTAANNWTQSEGLLATVGAVNLNTSTPTTLYTCPDGTTCVITKVVVRNASTSLTTASYSFGWNSAAFDNVIANATHTELTGSTLYTALQAKAGAAVGAAAGVFKVLANTLQGGAATVTVDVFGYMY